MAVLRNDMVESPAGGGGTFMGAGTLATHLEIRVRPSRQQSSKGDMGRMSLWRALAAGSAQ
jgi:hypothetical protein